MGAEIEQPVLSDLARDLNFTNEGGVCGTIRLLKNIAGLWLLESCRRCWADGRSYDDLLRAAAAETGWQSLVNPDDDLFLNPTNMPQAIAHYCDSTGQPPPQSPAAFTRAILESLVLKYRMVLEWLEQITGRRFRHIRIIGGGSRNALLNQLTANATGRTVLAGPMEATALGNIAMQMIAAVVVDSLESARTVIERSFPVERFEPQETEAWEQPLARFRDYCSRAVTPPVELSGGRSART
jgi:rhamnulokinase